MLSDIFGGLRRIVSSERYRVACLFEDDPPRATQLWRRWPELFPALDAVVSSLPEAAFLRSTQYDPEVALKRDGGGEVARFRKLKWNEANNRKWVADLAGRPGMELSNTEIWSPWHKDLEDRRGGPLFYLRLDAANETLQPAPEYDWQSLTIGIRHDVLPGTKRQVQSLIDQASALMAKPQLLIFDRSWAERGKYTSFIRVNGLEDSPPHTLERWCAAHPEAVRQRFDA